MADLRNDLAETPIVADLRNAHNGGFTKRPGGFTKRPKMANLRNAHSGGIYETPIMADLRNDLADLRNAHNGGFTKRPGGFTKRPKMANLRNAHSGGIYETPIVAEFTKRPSTLSTVDSPDEIGGRGKMGRMPGPWALVMDSSNSPIQH
uniref:Uncharacterized protein n=1 Tax=Globodera rostochiensis TaxID=31243 RepID=A0A914GVJ8_GLORO